MIIARQSTNQAMHILVDSAGHPQVDVLTMPSVTVTATDLDIRDLAATQDNILIYANTAKDGSGTNYVPLVDSDGHLQIDLMNSTVAVTQSGTWNIGTVTTITNSVTVTATNLDIRDLTSASDSIAAVQSGTWNIGTVTTLTGITNDVNIADGGNTITVDGTVSVTDATSTAQSNNQVSCSSTRATIITGSSSNKSVLIKNHGDNDVYVGDSSVTTATGLKLSKNESIAADTEASISGICAATETATVSYWILT